MKMREKLMRTHVFYVTTIYNMYVSPWNEMIRSILLQNTSSSNIHMRIAIVLFRIRFGGGFHSFLHVFVYS